MKQAVITLTAMSSLVFAMGCPVGVGDISCVKDDNCPTGMFCGADGICGEGIPPDRDARATDVGEPRRDGGAADVASAPDVSDAASDVGSDSFYPPDASDAGFDDAADTGVDTGGDAVLDDAGPDGSFDGGQDGGSDGGLDIGIEFNAAQSSLYQSTAGVCENDELIVKSVSGWKARQVMQNDE
ncbi:MAG: hypothetical protein HY897_09950, partial [Deltaproteobacteria bacterium]|nr:hypothetical protein [Deltaproteobacteria bacterium]